MSRKTVLLVPVLYVFTGCSSQACESFFSTDANPTTHYPSKQLATFVTKEFRPLLKKTDTLPWIIRDSYKQPSSECALHAQTEHYWALRHKCVGNQMQFQRLVLRTVPNQMRVNHTLY